MPLKQGHHGITISQPNEFELHHRPSFIAHLPPLSAREPAFSERPKILERGSFTQAAPIKEKKHFRHVSDSIGNNYSPQARHLTSSYIYETTKFNFTAEEHFYLTPRTCRTPSPELRSASLPTPRRKSFHALIDIQTGRLINNVDQLPNGMFEGLTQQNGHQATTVLPPIASNTSGVPSDTDYSSYINGSQSIADSSNPLNLSRGGNESLFSVDSSYDSGRPPSAYMPDMPTVTEDIEDESIIQDDDDFEEELDFESHDEYTRSILKVEFPPFYYSTHGLSRPSTPVEEDRPRYYQLIDNSIEPNMVSQVETDTVQGIFNLVPKELRQAVPAAKRRFLREMEDDRRMAIKKAILDYVLLDESEQERLGVPIPLKVSNPAGRYRFPWHGMVNRARDFMTVDLYITHPVMYTILYHFETKYGKFRLINIPDLRNVMPITMEDFYKHVQNSSKLGAQVLRYEWLPQCCEIVDSRRDDVESWMPQDDQALRMKKMDHFFASVSSLMSNLLRSCIRNSIYDLVELVEEYYSGNMYDGSYNIFKGLALPRLSHLVHFFMEEDLEAEDIKFKPTFPNVCDFFCLLIDTMIVSVEKLPSIENLLFQTVEDLGIKTIRSVLVDEELVQIAKGRIQTVVMANSHGPTSYKSVYKPYKYLLSADTENKVKRFITKDRSLRDYRQEIEKLKKIISEVASLPVIIPMHLFKLDCTHINQWLIDRARFLIDIMVTNIANTNRVFNREICRQYDNIVKKLAQQAENTEDLVQMQKYVENLKVGELLQLKDKQEVAGGNMMFLLDYTYLSTNDISLNTQTFTWAERIVPIISSTETKLSREHDIYSNKLKEKKKKFQEELDYTEKQIKMFQNKSNMNEAENYVMELEEIEKKLEGFMEEVYKHYVIG